MKNPNAATRNVDWVHITGMYLKATGAASTVLNLTSVGHADIENNRLVMGTGGSFLRHLRRHVHRRIRFHEHADQAQRIRSAISK